MWKSQRLLSVPLTGNRCPSLQQRLVRVGKWMQMLRILFFRIPSDDRVYTVLTAKKLATPYGNELLFWFLVILYVG
jgi:hypothetical protein